MILALPARAKLNLDLRVIGRRPDGFHDIKTTMQTIELHDLLTIESTNAETSLTLSGIEVPPGSGNSVLQAHAALERATGRKLGAKMHLDKRIPAGSGLGGASSDAATTLKGLTNLFQLDVDLAPIASEVGSDVPFFLHHGAALVEGRGERVTAIPAIKAWFAIAWPGIELSTRAVYQAWDEVRGEDLTHAAEHVEPRLKEFATGLGDGWRMTGSGSAFFKITRTQDEANTATAHLDCWTAVTR